MLPFTDTFNTFVFDDFTEAMASFDDDLEATLSAVLLFFICSTVDLLFNFTVDFTVTLQVAVLPFAVFAVMVAVPFFFAVTLPLH